MLVNLVAVAPTAAVGAAMASEEDIYAANQPLSPIHMREAMRSIGPQRLSRGNSPYFQFAYKTHLSN